MMILKKCALQCARVLGREVKVNQIVCDFLGYHRERIRAPLTYLMYGHAGKNLACSKNGVSDSFHEYNDPEQ
jgi:hypothetical protein